MLDFLIAILWQSVPSGPCDTWDSLQLPKVIYYTLEVRIETLFFSDMQFYPPFLPSHPSNTDVQRG